MADHKTALPPIWDRPTEKAIRLRLLINGDRNFEGKDVRLNKRRQRTFDSWLRELSTTLKLRCGAVDRLFTPNHGHRVNDFDRLQDGSTIVVAGKERFDKAVSYTDITAGRRQSPQRHADSIRSFKQYQQVPSKFSQQQTQGTIIKVWANGDSTNAPSFICLTPKQMVNLGLVLEEVSRKMCQKCGGPVAILCQPNGRKVRGLDEIVPNGEYVAVARCTGFKAADYTTATRPNLMTSPRVEKTKFPPISWSNKTSSQSSPEHSISSNNGYRRERAKRGESEGFHVHPVKHKRSSEKARQADYDQDNGGVFKAKSQNQATRGARQVDDSRQTKTELPIDQRPAEEVKEEVKGKDKKGKKQQQRDDEGNSPNRYHDQQRTYRANAKRPDSPGNEQARKEAEREARLQREADDRQRAEKRRKEEEAARQKKKGKENKKKREEERNGRDNSPPYDRYGDQPGERGNARESPYRSGTDLLREEQQNGNRRDSRGKSPTQEEDYGRRRNSPEDRGRGRNSQEDRARGRNSREDRGRGRNSRDDRKENDHDQEGDDWGPGLDDLERMAEEERERAAVKIQAGYRGMKARREVKAMRDFYY